MDGEYYTIELVKTLPSTAKSFQDAKADLLPLYIQETKKVKLLELAQNLVPIGNGETTDFITLNDAAKITSLSQTEANEFLSALFNKQENRSLITLNSGKIVLYNILEQKLLTNTHNNQADSIVRLKSAMFNEGLIKNLQNKYNTEIFIEGL